MDKNLPCQCRDLNPSSSDPRSFALAVALLTALGHLPPAHSLSEGGNRF